MALTKTVTFAMAGTQSSGKTVALATFFHEMSSPNFIGDQYFNLTATGPFTRDLNQKYMAMRTNGMFPAGNMETSIYDMQFQADDVVMCDLSIRDYKGALFHQQNAEEDKNYVELIQDLKHAALVVFLIGGDLVNKFIRLESKSFTEPNEEVKLESELSDTLGAYLSLMNIVAKDEEGIRKPVIYYVTKSDLIEAQDDRQKMKYIKSLLAKYRLIGNTTKGIDRKVLICHSTLGRNLDLVPGENRIRATESIQPEGFEMPILLTVGYAFSAEGDRWEAQEYRKIDRMMSQAQDVIDDARAAITRLDGRNRLIKFFTKKSTEAKKSGYIDAITGGKADIDALAAQRAQVQHNNKMRDNAMHILEYINKKNQEPGHLYTLYLDEHGGERPLQEFFAQNKQ